GSQNRESFTPGQMRALQSGTQGGSRMPELGPYGSVRGARGNSRPYRDPGPRADIASFQTHIERAISNLTDETQRVQVEIEIGALVAASCKIMSAPFSPIITMAALVLPDTTVGMIEPSITRRRSMPCTRNRSSTTAAGSVPMRQVLVG